MRVSRALLLPAVGALTVLTATALAAPADTTVEVKGVHLCCGACVKGVGAALKGVEGVKPKCDQKAGTISITASSEAAAQKALDALGAAGYFGQTDSKALAIKPAAAGTAKVSTATVSGLHNCCRSCCVAIKGAVKKAAGVKGDTAKPKAETFEVTGDFSPADVAKALNAAGFNATVK